MKKKGFTLIEILAVFAVLIVIFLITYPVIKKIVHESDKRAFLDEAYNVLDSYNYYYLDNQDDPNVYEEVNVKDLPLTNNKLEGFVYYDNSPYVYELTNGSFCIHYGTKESLNINDIVDGDCTNNTETRYVAEYIPNIDILSIGTNNIEIEISSSDDTINNYYCISRDDNKEACDNKTKFITSNSVVNIENLEENTTYNVYAYVENDTKESNIESLDVTTLISNPSISCSVDNLGWASKKKVTCTYPKSEFYVDSYKINDGVAEEASKTQEIEVYENSIITASSYNSIIDEESEYEEITYTITVDKIDSTNPIIDSVTLDNSIIQSEDRKVSVRSSDLESGIKGYAIVSYVDEIITEITPVSSSNFDIYLDNGSYILYVFDNAGNKSEPTSIVVKNVGKLNPTNAKLEVLQVRDDSITVLMQGEDLNVGIRNYSFSIDGTNFIDSDSNIYTFNNLEYNRSYIITGKIINNVGLYSIDSIEKTIKLDLTPRCVANTSGWVPSKEIICAFVYNNDYTYSYKIGNGSYTSDNINIEGNLAKVKITLDHNETISAKLIDNRNIEHTSSLVVDKIDSTVPTAPVLTYDEVDTFKIKTAPVVPSGIAYYEIYSSTSDSTLVDGEWVRVKFDNNSNSKINALGKKYSYVRAVSNSGIKGNISSYMESTLPVKPYLISATVDKTTIRASYSLKIKKEIRNYTCKIGINSSYSIGSYATNSLNCEFSDKTLNIPLNINSAYSFIICANAYDGNSYCSSNEIRRTVERVYLTDVAYVGAYVSYDAGEWSENEYAKKPSTTISKHNTIFNASSLKETDDTIIFGGTKYGSDRNPKYVESKNESAYGIKKTTNGWRILSYNKYDKSASIIHAGAPEYVAYRGADYSMFPQTYKISFEDYLDRHINKTYINKDYAYEGHNFNEDDFFDVVSEILMTDSNKYIDSNRKKVTKRYSFDKCMANDSYVYYENLNNKKNIKKTLVCGYISADDKKLINTRLSGILDINAKYIFNNYVISESNSDKAKPYYLGTSNYLLLHDYTLSSYAIRPVVDLHKELYVTGGNGTAGSPYILTPKDYTPSEDNAGKLLSSVAKQGDYVVYDAGNWTETKARPKLSTSADKGKFGGYTINTSRGSSVACYTEEEKLAPKEYNFRVVSTNGATTNIIHSGVSECYLYNKGYLGGQILDNIVNQRLDSLYLNDMYAESVRGFNIYDFREITGESISSCSSSFNNCGTNTIINNKFKTLVLSESNDKQYMWNGTSSNYMGTNRIYGIKPVVTLLSSVKIASGTGKKFDPYILKSGKAVTVPDIGIDATEWAKDKHTITILNYDSDKYTYEYGVTSSPGVYPTSTSQIYSSTFTYSTSGVKYIYVRAKDREDNYSEWSQYVISNIDKEPPTAPTLSIDSNTWKTDNHVITITGSSTAVSGINYYQYGIGSSSSEPTTWNRIDADPNSNISIDFTTFGEKYVYIRAISNAGSEGRSSYVISKLDSTDPTVTLKNNVLAPNSIITNFNVKDTESGITKYICYYKLSSASTYTEEVKTITISPSSSSTTISCTYSGLNLGTTYNTYMKVYNGAGFITETSVQTLTTKSGYEGDDLIRVVGMLNSSGNYTLKANGVSYDAEVYYYSGNTTLSGTQCSSVDGKMCIIKVDGNLTTSGTITPASNKKGFFIYVTGTLTNSGTISMTGKGSSYSGQNVYLWKNSSGTYEYVPATGAYGSCPGSCTWSSGNKYLKWYGQTGNSGSSSNRKTGGGGSGAIRSSRSFSTNYCSKYDAYGSCGSAGSSYAGGSGGAGSRAGQSNYNYTYHYSDYSSSQTSSFTPYGGETYRTSSSDPLGAGAGVYAGVGLGGSYDGSSGAGGLLIIYADTLNNNGYIYSSGSTGGKAEYAPGGGSGGGSINLFYQTSRTTGSTSASGGSGGSRTNSSNTISAGSGGSGAITWMQITLD